MKRRLESLLFGTTLMALVLAASMPASVRAQPAVKYPDNDKIVGSVDNGALVLANATAKP